MVRAQGLKIAKITTVLGALVSGELTELHILIHGRGVLPLLLCPEPAPDTEHLFYPGIFTVAGGLSKPA